MPFFDPETMGSFFNEGMQTTEALLFGRRTWQTMAAAWPKRAGDPFADRMNTIRKFVVSTTLTQEDLTWANSVLLRSYDVAGEVRRLLESPGDDLQVMGSSELARTLIGLDLVDEVRLMIEPITLAAASGSSPTMGSLGRWSSSPARAAPTGVLMYTYRPASH